MTNKKLSGPADSGPALSWRTAERLAQNWKSIAA